MHITFTIPDFTITLKNETSNPQLEQQVAELTAAVKESDERLSSKIDRVYRSLAAYAGKDQAEIRKHLEGTATRLEGLEEPVVLPAPGTPDKKAK